MHHSHHRESRFSLYFDLLPSRLFSFVSSSPPVRFPPNHVFGFSNTKTFITYNSFPDKSSLRISCPHSWVPHQPHQSGTQRFRKGTRPEQTTVLSLIPRTCIHWSCTFKMVNMCISSADDNTIRLLRAHHRVDLIECDRLPTHFEPKFIIYIFKFTD